MKPEIDLISNVLETGEMPAKWYGVEASEGELCEPEQESNGLAPILFILDQDDPGVDTEEKPLDQFKKDLNKIDLFYN